MQAGLLILVSLFLLSACSGSTSPDNHDRHLAASISLDTATVMAGRTVELPIYLSPKPAERDGIDSINSFTVSLYYDHASLQFNGASVGSAATDWGGLSVYGSARNKNDCSLTTIRLGARRKHPGAPMPWGEIATISFFAIPFSGITETSTEIGFVFDECGDNTLGDATDDSLLHFTKHVTIGDSTFAPADSLSCPRYLNLVADLELSAGHVRIRPDLIDREKGDLNRDGVVDVRDVVILVSALLRGDTLFSQDPVEREQQMRDLDVNWDGHPMQVSDLEMLSRLAFQHLNPADPIWPILAQAMFEFQYDPSGVVAILQSDIPITMLYLDIRYGPGRRPSFAVSSGTVPYDQLITDTNLAMIFEDLDYGAIANSFRPFAIRIRTEPGQSVCLRAIQTSTRPGVAVPVHTKPTDRCD